MRWSSHSSRSITRPVGWVRAEVVEPMQVTLSTVLIFIKRSHQRKKSYLFLAQIQNIIMRWNWIKLQQISWIVLSLINWLLVGELILLEQITRAFWAILSHCQYFFSHFFTKRSALNSTRSAEAINLEGTWTRIPLVTGLILKYLHHYMDNTMGFSTRVLSHFLHFAPVTNKTREYIMPSRKSQE